MNATPIGQLDAATCAVLLRPPAFVSAAYSSAAERLASELRAQRGAIVQLEVVDAEALAAGVDALRGAGLGVHEFRGPKPEVDEGGPRDAHLASAFGVLEGAARALLRALEVATGRNLTSLLEPPPPRFAGASSSALEATTLACGGRRESIPDEGLLQLLYAPGGGAGTLEVTVEGHGPVALGPGHVLVLPGYTLAYALGRNAARERGKPWVAATHAVAAPSAGHVGAVLTFCLRPDPAAVLVSAVVVSGIVAQFRADHGLE